MSELRITALRDFPLVHPGDELDRLICDALAASGEKLEAGDVLVIAQKVVSKSEDRYVRLAAVSPGQEAVELAARTDKDPRLVELILSESEEVVRERPGVVIVRHRLGYVHANAGIDRSNIAQDAGDEQVLLLPIDPDGSARKLRKKLEEHTGVAPVVIINDSAGRAWRNGTVGLALGSSGMAVLHDQIGETDLYDNELEVTVTAVADELAAAASFVMGQAREATPVVLIRGADVQSGEGSEMLIRERAMDLFT